MHLTCSGKPESIADIIGWVVHERLSSPIDPQRIPDEATVLAIEIIEAAKRYDPPTASTFFGSLIGNLELARQEIHG